MMIAGYLFETSVDFFFVTGTWIKKLAALIGWRFPFLSENYPGSVNNLTVTRVAATSVTLQWEVSRQTKISIYWKKNTWCRSWVWLLCINKYVTHIEFYWVSNTILLFHVHKYLPKMHRFPAFATFLACPHNHSSYPFFHSPSSFLLLVHIPTLAIASDTSGHKTPTHEPIASLPPSPSIQYVIYNLDPLTISPFVQKWTLGGTVTQAYMVTTLTLLRQRQWRQVDLRMLVWCHLVT